MNSENSDSLFRKILYSINSGDNVISNTCLEVVLDLMKYMSQNALCSEVVPYAIEKTHISKPVNERVVGCYLLGGAVINMDLTLVKRDILPVVQSLCQDDIADVRAAICTQFPIVYSALAGEKNSHLLVLPFLIELANDVDDKVCAEAWDAVLNMMPSLFDGVTETFILPMVKNFFRKCVSNGNELLLTVCCGTGKIFSLLDNRISLADKKWFLSYYIYLSQISTASDIIKNDICQTDRMCLSWEMAEYCKQQCASNFLTISRCCVKDNDKEIVDTLFAVLVSICGEGNNLIRTTMASNFHEITEIFFEFGITVMDIFLRLLSDADEDVCSSCISNLTAVLSLNADKGVFKCNEQLTIQTVHAINNATERVTSKNNWRIIVCLMEHQQNLPNIIPVHYLYTHLVHDLFKHLKNLRQVPCRIAVSTTLLVLMKKDSDSDHQNKIQSRMMQELCFSNSFYDRTIYVQLCLKVLELFPSPTIRNQFLFNLLHLTGDRVVNIRISICIIVPKLGRILINDKDNQSMAALQKIISALDGQTDKCILEQVKLMHKTMSEISTVENAYTKPDDSDPADKNIYVKANVDDKLNLNNNPNLISGVYSNLLRNSDINYNFTNYKADESSDTSRHPWSEEKEFLMDTGIRMKSATNSKIPAPNRKIMYNQLKSDTPLEVNLQLFDVKSKPPDKTVTAFTTTTTTITPQPYRSETLEINCSSSLELTSNDKSICKFVPSGEITNVVYSSIVDKKSEQISENLLSLPIAIDDTDNKLPDHSTSHYRKDVDNEPINNNNNNTSNCCTIANSHHNGLNHGHLVIRDKQITVGTTTAACSKMLDGKRSDETSLRRLSRKLNDMRSIVVGSVTSSKLNPAAVQNKTATSFNRFHHSRQAIDKRTSTNAKATVSSNLNDRVHELSLSDKNIDELSMKAKNADDLLTKDKAESSFCMMSRINSTITSTTTTTTTTAASNNINDRTSATTVTDQIRRNPSSLQRNTLNRRSLPSQSIPRYTLNRCKPPVRYYDDSCNVTDNSRNCSASKIFTFRKDMAVTKSTREVVVEPSLVPHARPKSCIVVGRSDEQPTAGPVNVTSKRSVSTDVLQSESVGTTKSSRLPIRHGRK